MYLALALFLATYVLLLIFGKYRAYIAAASALLFVVLGILPWAEVPAAIDWNVLLMIAGTMGTVVLFIESRMPALMADIIMEKVPNIKWAVVALSLFAGLISAFVDNVATVLMVAPVALALAKKLEELLAFSIPLYQREGKSQLVVAVGCTGGRHRSVAIACQLAAYLRSLGYRVELSHRDKDNRR